MLKAYAFVCVPIGLYLAFYLGNWVGAGFIWGNVITLAICIAVNDERTIKKKPKAQKWFPGAEKYVDFEKPFGGE